MLLSVLLPLSVRYFPFDIKLLPLRDVFLADFGQLPPGDDVVPLSCFYPFVSLRGRQGEFRYLAVGGGLNLRGRACVAQEVNTVGHLIRRPAQARDVGHHVGEDLDREFNLHGGAPLDSLIQALPSLWRNFGGFVYEIGLKGPGAPQVSRPINGRPGRRLVGQ